jgi:hypothetical protein
MDTQEETTGTPVMQQWNKGLRLKEQLCLRSKRTSSRTFRKGLVLEVMKQRVESSVRIRKISDWTSRRGWPSPKQRRDH